MITSCNLTNRVVVNCMLNALQTFYSFTQASTMSDIRCVCVCYTATKVANQPVAVYQMIKKVAGI